MKTLREVTLKDRDRRAVTEAAERLRAEFAVERIIVFGSKIKGTDDDISDIDILILTSHSVGWQEKSDIVRLLSRIGRQFDVFFDPIVHSIEEWTRGIPEYFPIHHHIEREGILVA